jgi:hypothetical protein
MSDHQQRIFRLAGFMPKTKVNTTTLVQYTIQLQQRVNHLFKTLDRQQMEWLQVVSIKN